jgi:cysteine desulfurase
MTMPVYLDSAATTPIDPRVAAVMTRILRSADEYGNPASSTHEYGDRAGELVDAARERVAASVGATNADVVWTSGATEANNLAIFGVTAYYANQGRHIITARTEHKAVIDPCWELERRGWRVTWLIPGPDGIVGADQVEAALEDDTILVSLMQVNNEIGVIQDTRAIAAVCAQHDGARLHVDAAQSVGKVPIDFGASGADLMSLSAHKAYGPKGVGALLVSQRRGVRLEARQFGGGQERGLRSGTLAPHQLAGMATAFTLASQELPKESQRIGALRRRLWDGLAALGGVLRNGTEQGTVPQLLNVSFEDVEGEALLASVSELIAVSSGSACTSSSNEPSYVLRALGRSDRLAESSLRFGLGRFTHEADIDQAITAVGNAVKRLRKISGQCATAA